MCRRRPAAVSGPLSRRLALALGDATAQALPLAAAANELYKKVRDLVWSWAGGKPGAPGRPRLLLSIWGCPAQHPSWHSPAPTAAQSHACFSQAGLLCWGLLCAAGPGGRVQRC